MSERPRFSDGEIYTYEVDRATGRHRVEFLVSDIETKAFRCRSYVGRRAANGGSDTALILHGAFDDDAFVTPRHGLAERFQVVSIDLPGHGDSGLTADGFSLLSAAEGVASLPYLRPLNGRALLIGASIGGIIALMAGLRAPESLAGVCLIDPPVVMAKLARYHAEWTRIARARASRGSGAAAALARDVLGLSAFGGDPSRIDYSQIFAAAPIPILVIAGQVAEGSVLDDEDLERLQALAGPALTSCRVNGGHKIWIDQHPEVVRQIESWWQCTVRRGTSAV